MRSIAFVFPHGEPREGFFPDTAMRLLCQAARARGDRAELVAVYYDGHHQERDDEVASRLVAWLAERQVDVVVVERLFDPKPLREHVAAHPHCQVVHLSLGDADPLEEIDWLVGKTPGSTRSGRTRRAPSLGEMVVAFVGLLDALERGADPLTVPGVAAFRDGAVLPGPSPNFVPLPRPFEPVLEQASICMNEPPPVTRRYLVGNAGCPFAQDPLANPFYRGVHLPQVPDMARLGCAFCQVGGDYQKRDDEVVVTELIEQVQWFLRAGDGVRQMVISDQHPIRYLKRLMEAARSAGLPRLRWLFPARADTFVREEPRVREAIEVAEGSDQELEVYLSGFESFSDEELLRYNKGVTADELVNAVSSMRQLAQDFPETFRYAEARGHSLILWSPWTTPDDLRQSAERMRRHGLAELFSSPSRNRLRLYPDLPIYYAAERDGALLDAWEEGDEGAARTKGYGVERPWRFLNPRTRAAFALMQALGDRLGHEGALAHLTAVLDYVQSQPVEAMTGDWLSSLLGALESLDGALRSLGMAGPSHAPVLFSGSCNNGCQGCGNRDSYLDDRGEALMARVEQARATGKSIVLAGREPTVHPAFWSVLQAAHGEDHRPVALVSNGRVFAYPAFVRRAVGAGLRAASIKIFDTDAARADAVARVPSAHEQSLSGLSALVRASVATEIRVPLRPGNLPTLAAYADLASRLGIPSLLVEVALDALGLSSLERAAEAIDDLKTRSRMLGVAVHGAPLSLGPRAFDRVRSSNESSRISSRTEIV